MAQGVGIFENALIQVLLRLLDDVFQLLGKASFPEPVRAVHVVLHLRVIGHCFLDSNFKFYKIN